VAAQRAERQAEDQTVHFEAPRKKRARSDSVMNVNLTPAIDITFNLLIFFVVATTFKAAEGVLSSEAPAQQGVLEATPLPVSPIKVRVRQTGEASHDYELKIDNYAFRPDSFIQLTEVLQELQQQPGFDVDTPVIIFAHQDARWDLVVRCYNAILRVREPFKNVSFAAGRN
jgi:biopolymer transport protein ExbD